MTHIVEETQYPIDLLRKDKVHRVEGICTETLFSNTILMDKDLEVSGGWWYVKKNNNHYMVKHVSGALSKLDIQLARMLSKQDIPVCLAKRDRSKRGWCFKQVLFDPRLDEAGNEAMMERGRYMSKLSEPPEQITMNDHDRYEETLDYLKRSNANLDEIISARVFANYFGTTTMWDIDYFVSYRNTLFTVELKHKYPADNGTFGLNRGSRELSLLLHSSGFKNIHLILSKPVHKHKFSAVRFFQGHYREKAKWFIHLFTENSFKNLAKVNAPARTSLGSNRSQPYYTEDIKSFEILGTFNDVTSSDLKRYMDKIIDADHLQFSSV